jgi:hypothetical protein
LEKAVVPALGFDAQFQYHPIFCANIRQPDYDDSAQEWLYCKVASSIENTFIHLVFGVG